MTLANEKISALLVDVTVRRGDSGNAVRTLQTLLNYRGAGLTVDGNFGANTEARVLEFQRSLRATPDGIVGAKTWTSLRAGTVVARVAGSPINMRAKPERDAAVVQLLKSRDPVVIVTRSAVLAENYRWFQVQTKQATGWVREDLVNFLNPFTIEPPIVDNVLIQSRPRPWFMGIDPGAEAAIRQELKLGFRDRVRYASFTIEAFEAEKELVLVYLLNVGGTGGSTLLVLQPNGAEYRVISRITTVQQPVVISNEQTKGYRDLIVYTAGGGLAPAYRRLRFDGSRYPSSPTAEPALPAGTVIEGIVLASRITPDLAAPIVTG